MDSKIVMRVEGWTYIDYVLALVSLASVGADTGWLATDDDRVEVPCGAGDLDRLFGVCWGTAVSTLDHKHAVVYLIRLLMVLYWVSEILTAGTALATAESGRTGALWLGIYSTVNINSVPLHDLCT